MFMALNCCKLNVYWECGQQIPLAALALEWNNTFSVFCYCTKPNTIHKKKESKQEIGVDGN